MVPGVLHGEWKIPIFSKIYNGYISSSSAQPAYAKAQGQAMEMQGGLEMSDIVHAFHCLLVHMQNCRHRVCLCSSYTGDYVWSSYPPCQVKHSHIVFHILFAPACNQFIQERISLPWRWHRRYYKPLELRSFTFSWSHHQGIILLYDIQKPSFQTKFTQLDC